MRFWMSQTKSCCVFLGNEWEGWVFQSLLFSFVFCLFFFFTIVCLISRTVKILMNFLHQLKWRKIQKLKSTCFQLFVRSVFPNPIQFLIYSELIQITEFQSDDTFFFYSATISLFCALSIGVPLSLYTHVSLSFSLSFFFSSFLCLSLFLPHSLSTLRL